mmetsp:Transcript_37554/g.83625  ORF Transcript_37554/g.83625 Transcript_37554/m.83625 type:complete len:82 (+) Transcript_37554:361-606(+)
MYGVVGAPCFTDSMLATARQQGMITVYPKDGWYHIQPPKHLWSCVQADNPKAAAVAAVRISKEQLEEAQDLEFEREHYAVE